MAFCSGCGEKIDEKTKFCSSCGTKINSAEEKPLSNKINLSKEKNSINTGANSKKIIGLAVLILLGVIILIGGGKGEDTKYICSDGSTVSDISLCQNNNVQKTPSSTFCGDGRCQANEDCSSCSSDCGVCQQTVKPVEKQCKTIHTAGGFFSDMLGIPPGITWWVENVCGYSYPDGSFPDSEVISANRFCQSNILVDEYYTCENNLCIKKAKRFDCATLATNGKCYNSDIPRIGWGRPECYVVDASDDWRIISTN